MDKLIGPFPWEDHFRWAVQKPNGDIYYYRGESLDDGSDWSYRYVKATNTTSINRNPDPIRVIIRPSPNQKCQRCYNRKDENKVRPDGGVLCDRCASVMGVN